MCAYHIHTLYEPKDIPEVVELAKDHHASSRYASKPFDPERVSRLVMWCIDSPSYVCAVLRHNIGGPIVGYMAAYTQPYVWSDMMMAQEMALYIAPEHRTYNTAKALILHVEEWAKKQGAEVLDIGSSSAREMRDVLRVGQMYNRMGYTFHTVSYVKELQT